MVVKDPLTSGSSGHKGGGQSGEGLIIPVFQLPCNALSGLHKCEGPWPATAMAGVRVRGPMGGPEDIYVTLRFGSDALPTIYTHVHYHLF